MQQRAVVVVLGAGLAGLSAAAECIKAAHAKGVTVQVVMLEKCANAGGNSFRASSGINALTPATGDNAALFESDTLRSGGGLSDQALVQRLVTESENALAFLTEAKVDLSRVTRLGGHSAPRTHSNPVGPNVGFAITNALLSGVKAAANVELVFNAQVKDLAMEGGRVTGVTYSGPPAVSICSSGGTAAAAGVQTLQADAVIIATGGFAASHDMLQEYCPSAAEYATTNGPWATGDGVKAALAAGAGVVHMDQVQLHPTGFVDLQAPDAKSKWLAPERLRGCGAILLNEEGDRFVDELQRRDVVTSHMIQLPRQRALLLVGPEAAQQFGVGPLEFYTAKGMMKKAEGLAAVSAAMSVPAERLQSTLDKYNAACSSGTDEFGKQYFPSGVHLDMGPSYVGVVTPVVHYCMGGVKVGQDAEVQQPDGRVIPGLFAAGEVTGGLHGANRLGGNSLLDCVVFGRAAGASALEYTVAQAVVSAPTPSMI